MNHEQLEIYINNFRENQREEIYKQIIDSEILQKAFSTSEGKVILGNCVELITSNVLQIVRCCAENPPKDSSERLYHFAAEINTTYKLMTEWAKILIRGDQHREKAEKI